MPYIGKSPDLNASVDTNELADGSVTVSKLSSVTKSVLSSSFAEKAGSPVSASFHIRGASALSASFIDKAGASVSASFMDKAGAAVSASFVTNVQSGSFASGSDVYSLMQATGSLVGRAVASASFISKDGAAVSASFHIKGASAFSQSFIAKDGAAVSGTFATRASVSSSLTSGNESVQFDQVTGSSALFTGRMTVGEVFTQYVSSSVLVESSGSTKLGNSSDDLHQITGSVSVLSGSLILRGTAAAQEKISGSAYSTGSFGRVEATNYSGDGSALTGIDIPTAAAISGSHTSGFEFDGSISGSSTSTGSFGQIALGKQSVSPPSASNQTKIYAKKDTKPDNFTRLLIHSDNVDGSTAFADSGSFGYSIARTGSAAGGGNLPEHRSTQANFGNTSMYFTSSALLMITGSNDFMGGNSDFTLECRVKATTLSGLQPRLIGDSAGTWFLRIGDGGGVKCVSAYNGNWYAAGSEGEVSPNVWYHIAWTRSSGTNRFFLNGDLMSTTITDASMVSTNVYIGGTAASADLDGYMDEIRVSDIARWTDDFQGALPTEPYETDTNTKLLIHSDTRDRSPYFIDSSEVTSTRKSITAVGNAKHTSSMTPTFGEATSSIKFGSSAMYFDGSGDYLSIPAHDDFDFSQVGGSFTIDGWFNLEEAQDNTWACGYNSAYPPVGIYFNTTGDRQQIRVYGSTDGATLDINTAGEDVHDKVGSWMHLAIVSDGGSIKLYVDGEHLGPTVQKTPATNGAQEFWIGHGSTSNNPFKGWIDEFRVSRGIARWTSNFTPPKRRYPINENRLYVKSDDGIEKTIEVIQPYGVAVQGQVLKSLGESGVRWGSAGITEINHWALDTDMTASGTIVNGFYEPNSRGESKLGMGMSQASGVFKFPSTGHWLVQAQMTHSWSDTNDYVMMYIQYSDDNDGGGGSFVTAFEGGWQGMYVNGRAATSLSGLFEITDTNEQAVKFAITSEESTIWGFTNAAYSRNYFQFIRLADT